MMLNEILNTEIQFLKGVGPKRAEVLIGEFGVHTFEELLYLFPFRYIDRSKIISINKINSETTYIQLKGKITNTKTIGTGAGRRYTAILQDETGNIELVWFKGIKWLENRFSINNEYLVFGKPSEFNHKYNISHPEVEIYNPEDFLQGNFQAVYSSSEKLNAVGLGSKGIEKIIRNLFEIEGNNISENLNQDLILKYKLLSRKDAFKQMHFPESTILLEKAQKRFKFEELFFFQLDLVKNKIQRKTKDSGFVFSKIGEAFNDFYSKNLQFELTAAQKRVVKEIRIDMGSGKQMNRLLQGDVGSGKTLVALLCCLIAIDNGYQSCIMAPTEILAQQHYKTIGKFLHGLNIEFSLLTGNIKGKQRAEILKNNEKGQIKLLIGTHALIEDSVKFLNLGLAVIDEQHRFGVEQRAKLWKKNSNPPHVLVTTATPIPRTMAMTLYGDLDYSVIDELPPGRKPVKTYLYFDTQRAFIYDFIKKQISEGRQVYIVYPLINESETLDLKDLQLGYENMLRLFPLPNYRISIVHGQMKSDAKEYEMQRFIQGYTHIMIATTVIEVGVDVPNASVMVIENAERFGLSQLHQLRGRVGRGADQSFCILMASYKLSKEAKIRLETMTRTSDGFEIADVDLKLRGPGDMKGTQQSGVLDLKIADLVKDEKIIKAARQDAIEIIENDPLLSLEKNTRVAYYLKKINLRKSNWDRIS